MKTKMMLLVSLFAAGAAFATATDVTASHVLGAMPVSLAANQTEAIISIPWVEAGTAATEGIAVSNMVKTANLADGDMLYWYNTESSAWEMWYLTTGSDSVRYWQAVSTSGDGELLGGFHKVAASATVLKRGQAVLLKRKGTLATTIFVIGQYSAGETDILSIAKGTKNAPKVTMIAPPKAAATDLNDATWTNVGADDIIYIRAGDGGLVKTFSYKDSEWGYETLNTSTKAVTFNNTAVVPVGCGAFYVSQTDGGSAPTMSWPAAN